MPQKQEAEVKIYQQDDGTTITTIFGTLEEVKQNEKVQKACEEKSRQAFYYSRPSLCSPETLGVFDRFLSWVRNTMKIDVTEKQVIAIVNTIQETDDEKIQDEKIQDKDDILLGTIVASVYPTRKLRDKQEISYVHLDSMFVTSQFRGIGLNQQMLTTLEKKLALIQEKEGAKVILDGEFTISGHKSMKKFINNNLRELGLGQETIGRDIYSLDENLIFRSYQLKESGQDKFLTISTEQDRPTVKQGTENMMSGIKRKINTWNEKMTAQNMTEPQFTSLGG